jgi:thymidylate synthase
MYLGTELQKAELSLSREDYFIYEQDKPIKFNDF